MRLAAALLTLLTPAVAAACPVCAGRSDGGIVRSLILVAFVLFPFPLAYFVIRFIRAGERQDPRPRVVRAPTPWSLQGPADEPPPG